MIHRGVLLDLDGTVRKTKSGKVTPDDPSDQELLPGRKEKLHALKKAGYKLIAVTNQGGVALGHVTHDQVKSCLADLDHQLGYVFDDMLYCGDHPKSGSKRRKPEPGMLLEAMKTHGLDPKKTTMVGDMDSDKGAAAAAGVEFVHAKDFFKKE